MQDAFALVTFLHANKGGKSIRTVTIKVSQSVANEDHRRGVAFSHDQRAI